MSRSKVLRSVVRVLEDYEPLAILLGHVKDAESVAEGARIVGDTARLELNGHLPILILSFSDSQGLNPQREDKSWEVEVFVHSEDIFEAADVVDAVERACLACRLDKTLPQPLNQISPGPAERVASERGSPYLIEFRAPLSVRWIETE